MITHRRIMLRVQRKITIGIYTQQIIKGYSMLLVTTNGKENYITIEITG